MKAQEVKEHMDNRARQLVERRDEVVAHFEHRKERVKEHLGLHQD